MWGKIRGVGKTVGQSLHGQQQQQQQQSQHGGGGGGGGAAAGGPDPLDEARSYGILAYGNQFAADGEHAKALACYNKALVLQRRSLGEDDEITGRTLRQIGNTLVNLGKHEAALTALEEALYIRQQHAGGVGDSVAVEIANEIWAILHEKDKRGARGGSAAAERERDRFVWEATRQKNKEELQQFVQQNFRRRQEEQQRAERGSIVSVASSVARPDEDGYADRDRGCGNRDRGYGDRDRGYGDQERDRYYGDRNRWYGDQDRGYGGDRDRGYGDQDRGYGDRDRDRGYNDRNGGHGDRGDRSGYGDRDRGYGHIDIEALNFPPLVALAGASGILGMPFLERLAADGVLSLAALKTANVVSFAVQLVAVSIPGRIDGQVAEAMAEERIVAKGGAVAGYATDRKKEQKGKDQGKVFTPRNGRTLVSPAGWAFAIWGLIFLGEMAFVASQFSVEETSALAPVLRKVSVPFAMAQTFQTLWCAAFRPKYKGNLMYISSVLLGAVAYSLSRAHAAFTSVNKSGVASPHGLLFLPLAMHFGWTTAASLVNLNGALSMKESTSEKTIALAGHASAVVAAGLGVFITVTRSAPTFGGVIAWALLACADGMRDRLEKARANEKKDEDNPPVGVYGARTQFNLCRLGALTSGAAALLVAGKTFLGSRSQGAP